jgi:hypothetical protein
MIGFKLSQLVHKPRIRQNLASLRSDQIQTIIQTQIIILDQIGQNNTGAPADPCKTVHQTPRDFPGFFQKRKTLLKIFAQILRFDILCQDLLMKMHIFGTIFEPCSIGDGEDRPHSTLQQQVDILGGLDAAQKKGPVGFGRRENQRHRFEEDGLFRRVQRETRHLVSRVFGF